jgi:hypothetical protein
MAKKHDVMQDAAVTVGQMLGKAAGTASKLKKRGNALSADASDRIESGQAVVAQLKKKAAKQTKVVVKKARAVAKKTTKKVAVVRKRAKTAQASARKVIKKARKARGW